MTQIIDNLIYLFENNIDHKSSFSVSYAVNCLMEYLKEQPEDDDINYAKFIVKSLLQNIEKFYGEEYYIVDSFATAYDVLYSLKENE